MTINRAGRRTDQQLIHPDELAQLRELAQDGKDMRAALNSLKSKRLKQMEVVREGGSPLYDAVSAHARGWLEFESDLGDALLKAQEARGGEAPF